MPGLLPACLWAALIAVAPPAHAALLFLKGFDAPQHVLTIRETDANLVVGVPQPDGTFVERVVERANIDQLIHTVAADRLAALDPARPAMYRDYAEELAEKRVDPDARRAAIRLYLIAAWLAPAELGRSSLLGMTALARTPAEDRKFRAMAYLLDPRHDPSVLVVAAGGASATSDGGAAEDGEMRQQLGGALRLLRQGNGRIAERMVDRPSVRAALAKYGGPLTPDEFVKACRASGELEPALMARLLRLEIELLGGGAAAPATAESGRPNWSAAVDRGGAPAASLTLETLTEFNPRECVYVDGAWKQPAK